MVNRPKQLGTAAESAVEGWLRSNGHPHAERRSLRGSEDWGDITGCPGLCIEVKVAGSVPRLSTWLAETKVEQHNCAADYGFLVMKPAGYGATRVGQWWAAMYNGDWEWLLLALGLSVEVGTLSVLSGARVKQLWERMHYFQHAFAGGWDAKGSSILIHAKGVKDEKMWYRVTTLECMNALLVAAGYGNRPDR